MRNYSSISAVHDNLSTPIGATLFQLNTAVGIGGTGWFNAGPLTSLVFNTATLTGAYGAGDPFEVPFTVLNDGSTTSKNRPSTPANTLQARVVNGNLELRSNNGNTGFSIITLVRAS